MAARFGRWRVIRTIARGDLADVVLVDDDSGGDPIALKRLHVHVLGEREVVDLFAAERALACALPRHPNLVPGLEHGVVDGRPYLAMPYIAGEDLRTRRERGPMTGATAAAWVKDAARACAHLHAHGWIHGDVGPANLIADGEAAWLCDFGVARRTGTDGPVRGTHAYMAPEQVRGEAWTPATDVFALGVVLWELTAGARLFHRGPTYLTMAAVIEAEVPPLAGDPAIDAIARAALEKDPARRLDSAAELASRLDAVPA